MKDKPPQTDPPRTMQDYADRIASFPQRRKQDAAPETAESPEKRPAIGMRVDAARRDEFDALRPLYPSADGANGTRSDVLRAMVDIGFAIVGDPEVHARLKHDAKERGVSLGELLRQRMTKAGALK